MGHGPAIQRSSREKLTEFLDQFDQAHTVTHKAATKFLGSCPVPSAIPTLHSLEFDALLTAIAGRGPAPAPSKTYDWGQSPEEFARLFIAAQSLIKLTNVSETAGKLTISIGTNSKPWPVPSTPSPAPTAIADLDGRYDDEVWSQSSSPEIFMMFAANRFGPNHSTKFMGLAVDLASLVISDLLFRAKILAGVKRPYEVDSNHPVALPKPEHSSWPGGHAFWAGAMAAMIFEALQGKLSTAAEKLALWQQLRCAADRIAKNRVRAGLHWEQDSTDGFAQGKFAMESWIAVSRAKFLAPEHAGDAGDLWRLLIKV